MKFSSKTMKLNNIDTVPYLTYNSLSEIASHENISFNQLVLQCCRYAIDNYGTTEESTESGV